MSLNLFKKPVFWLLLAPLQIFAWGTEGHRITGEIADHYLDKRIKDSLEFYIGTRKVENVTSWMDEVRGNSAYDYLKPFHYINLEKGQSYSADSTNNIIGELLTVIDELEHRNKLSKEKIALDIKILCHLMGDLHQPLHVGYGTDQGGNTVQVQFMHHGSNLHKVWDTDIIEQYNVSARECIKFASKYSKEDLQKLEELNVIGWMKESRSYLLQVYDAPNTNLDYEYATKNRETIVKLLSLSGLRLSSLLDKIFA